MEPFFWFSVTSSTMSRKNIVNSGQETGHGEKKVNHQDIISRNQRSFLKTILLKKAEFCSF